MVGKGDGASGAANVAAHLSHARLMAGGGWGMLVEPDESGDLTLTTAGHRKPKTLTHCPIITLTNHGIRLIHDLDNPPNLLIKSLSKLINSM